MIAWPNGIFDEEPRKERGPRTGKRAWYDPYADDRFFYRLNRSHAHQMFLAALKQCWTTLHKHCYWTVGFLVAIQLFVSCSVPAALAVAYAALTQSFFVTVAVQRKKRSCNLYAMLVAALMSRLSSAVLTYSVSYGTRQCQLALWVVRAWFWLIEVQGDLATRNKKELKEYTRLIVLFPSTMLKHLEVQSSNHKNHHCPW